MRVMSMSGLEPDFGEGEGGLFKELRAQRIKLNESLKKKTELSFDEEKVGKGVAEYFAAQLPAGVKVKKEKHPTEFAAVNAAFGDDDPRRELMPVVKENYKTLLRNKEYAGADEKQLLDLAYQVTVKGTPSQELEGATLEDDIHRHKYKSDTALFGGGNVAAAPGYDAWLENEKARPMEDRQIGFGTGIAANLAFGLGARALKKPVANFIGKSLLKAGIEGLGQTLTKVGPPQGKLVGAALMLAATAIPETMAYNAIAKTDWYRAREDEPVKRELAGLAATIVGGTAAYKVGAKTGASILKKAAEKELVSQSALNVFLKDQDAKAIIAIGKARREEKAARDVLSKTLETVPSDVERKAWFEALGKSEEQLFGKTTDEEFLKGKFRRANRNLQRQLLLKSPVEEKPFGWAGEANGPTRFGRAPGYTSRTISSFDDLSVPMWDGTGGGAARVNSNLGEPWFDQQMGTPLQTSGANFEGYPFWQARRTGEQLALPPGSQLGLPSGGPGQQALPPSGTFGPRGFWTDVPPTEPTSGGAGGGGIFGFKPQELPKKTVVATTPEGQPIFGLSKKVQEQTFSKLSEDEAVLVTDQVLNGGKSLSDALEGMSQSRAIRKALETTEAKVTVAQKKTTVLPPDNVIGYEGAEAAAESGKAAKVMVLKQEVAEAAPELAARKTAEEKAVQSTASVIRETTTLVDDVVRGVAPASKESVELTDDVVAEGLRYLGSKSRNIAPHQLDQEVARLRAAKVNHPEFYKEADEFGSDVVAGPRRVRSEQAVLDPTRQTSDFEILSKLGSRRTAKDVDDYVTRLTEYDAQTGGYFYRNLEAERLYNYLTKQGVPVDKIDSHPISVEFRKLVAQANERIDEVVAPVADDLAEFGGSSIGGGSVLKMFIPAAAVGTISVAAVLGLPEDSHASVASVIGEAAARGIKALPKAWISTIQDAVKIKNIGHADEKKLLAGLIEKMDKANLVLRNADSKVLPPRAVVPNYVSLAKETYGSLEAGVNRQTKGLPLGVERILSPYSRGEIHYKPGANPTVHLAHMQTLAGGNTENAFRTFERIMADVKDGKSYAGDLIKEFQPLAEKYAPVIEVRNTLLAKVKQREKALAVLDKELARKKLPQEDLEKLTAKKKWTIDKLEMEKTALRNSDPDFQAYLKDYDVLVKSAAQKYPSTRIFLAAEDTQDFQHYPWLKDVITSEEKEAATYLKAMMKTYEESIVAQGMNVISNRPYMHHGWHPQWYKSRNAKWEKYAEQIGASELPLTTVPYNQFHSRMFESRALVPDAWHSIQSYIPMAEKVLGWNAFWNKNGKVGESWYKHMRSSTVQGDPKLRSMWNAIYDASIPVQQTQVDKWANRYFQFEVFRLLGGSPSVAYKHLFKLTGTYSSSGVGEAMSHFGEAGGAITRQWLNNPKLAAIAEKFGVNPQRSKKFYDDALRTFIHQAKRNNILDDYDLLPPTQLGWFDNMMQNINHHAGFMTSGIEGFDRAHQFLTAASMAAKRGLTERDASYAIFDGILKNNFLGGVQNPAWAKSTGVRALMLFQTTAFKIAERRLITAMKSGRALHEVWKSVKGTDWTYDKVLSEMKTLKNFMMKGEYEFKKGIITDALASERDFIGQFAIRQGVREMIYGGIILGGGAAMGHDYSHHLFHLPFLGKSQDGEPVVGLSPIARGAWDTMHGAKFGGEESDFGLVGDFLNNWFRSQGPIPQMISKGIKASQDDIPEIYREEGFLPKEFRYFLAIPSTKEKE